MPMKLKMNTDHEFQISDHARPFEVMIIFLIFTFMSAVIIFIVFLFNPENSEKYNIAGYVMIPISLAFFIGVGFLPLEKKCIINLDKKMIYLNEKSYYLFDFSDKKYNTSNLNSIQIVRLIPKKDNRKRNESGPYPVFVDSSTFFVYLIFGFISFVVGLFVIKETENTDDSFGIRLAFEHQAADLNLYSLSFQDCQKYSSQIQKFIGTHIPIVAVG
jgi:hypothetical protein